MRERERERIKIPVLHRAFTLIEMLIVVTIIGMLATAILPRVNGILERAKDLQRKTGLQQIAAALELYKDAKWHYPLREPTNEEWTEINAHEKYKYKWGRYYNLEWGTNGLEKPLQDYLKEIPKDPQKSTQITLEEDYENKRFKEFRGGNVPHQSYPKWEFYYRLTFNDQMITTWPKGFGYRYQYPIGAEGKKNGSAKDFSKFGWSAILVAKVELPENANFIARSQKWWKKQTPKPKRRTWNDWWAPWSRYFYIPTRDVGTLNQEQIKERSLSSLHLCNKIEKVKEWEETFATAENKTCGYSSKDQLYYIIKLD